MLLPPAYLHAHPSGPPPTGDALIMTFTMGDGEDCKIGTANVGTYNATINWGDGTGDLPVTSHNDANLTHVYTTGGTYTVTITGQFPSLAMGTLNTPRRGRLMSVEQWGTTGFLDLRDAFLDCPNVVINATDAGDFSQATTFRSMFEGATSITDIPGIEDWVTTALTNLNSTFKNMSMTFNRKLNWNTSLVTSLIQFCRNSPGLDPDVSAFNVENVGDCTNIFEGSGLSTVNYDLLLAAWAPQNVQSGVVFDASRVTWTDGISRDLLISKGWTLNDLCHRDDFCFTVQTTSNNEDFMIDTRNYGTYNANVDWGDGQQSTITSWNDPDLTHTYVNPGTHKILVSGSFPAVDVANKATYRLKWRSIENWGDAGFRSLRSSFWGCSNLINNARDVVKGLIDEPYPQSMFRACTSLMAVDFAGVTWSNNLTLQYSFDGCSDLERIDNFPLNTGDVATFTSLFRNAPLLNPSWASGFDFTNATHLWGTFQNCGIQDIDFSGISFPDLVTFQDCFRSSNQANPNFNGAVFSGVTNMSLMFANNAEAMTTQNVDNFLKAIYDERMNFGWGSPSVDISACQPPSGAEPPEFNNPPTTGTDYIYWLRNDPLGELFNTWTITY